MSDRWKLGDVIIWMTTGDQQGARADADVTLKFFDEQEKLLGWVRAYERNDDGGFEQGDTNCGFIGNLNRQPWLKAAFLGGKTLEVSIETEEDERWFLESVSLDFRVGPVIDVSTARVWNVNEWIGADGEPQRFVADGVPIEGASMFEEVGFEKELEIESGAADAGTA